MKVDQIKKSIGHPIVDADAHVLEFMPALVERIGDAPGGGELADRFRKVWDSEGQAGLPNGAWYRYTPEERIARRVSRAVFWAVPSDAKERATAMLPSFFYERMDEIGLDFSIVYPSLGLTLAHVQEEDMRRAAIRALNEHNAELFSKFSDRLTHVAIIPMHSPDEAIEELNYAIGTLGMKAILMPSYVHREIEAFKGDGTTHPSPYWYDVYGIDSAYDYDPVWQACFDLQVAPSFHSASFLGHGRSSSNSMYTHMNIFASSHEALAKGLVLGGVTRRFPDLHFAFLEGGVAWAAELLSLFLGHWEKRNGDAIQLYNPERLDRKKFIEYFNQYSDWVKDLEDEQAFTTLGLFDDNEDPATVDEFAAMGAKTKDEVVSLFADRFWFGCEADDPMVPIAFTGPSPRGTEFKAILGSDIGHWDVPVIAEVLEEAWELVEDGAITEQSFQKYTYENAVRLHGGMNPHFFDNTVVEKQAGALLRGEGAS